MSKGKLMYEWHTCVHQVPTYIPEGLMKPKIIAWWGPRYGAIRIFILYWGWGDLPGINVAISKGLLASLVFNFVMSYFFSLSCRKLILPAIIFVFVRKTGVHLAMVRLSSLSTNIDLDIVDDKERIISSLHGHLKMMTERAAQGYHFLEGQGGWNRGR